MKLSLEKRIISFSFIILLLTILANTGMDISAFRKDYLQGMLLRAQGLASSLRSTVEKVISLGIDIREVNGLGEKCRDLVQADPDMTYCVVTDTEGHSLYSSDPAFSSILFPTSNSLSEDKIIQKASRLTVDGASYYNASLPVRSLDSKIIAAIHVGFPQANVNNKVKAIILRSFVLFLLVFLLSFSFVVIMVKRSIIMPISVLLEGVKSIAGGNLRDRIPQLSSYDFNELGLRINDMSQALETRDQELKKNFEELSSTHEQLHSSFMQLEKLSLKLEKSEDLFRKLLEEASDAIVILDQSEKVIILNRRAEDFFGYAASEIIGLHISNLFLMLKIQDFSRILQIFRDAFNGIYIADEIAFTNSFGKNLVARIHASLVSLDDTNLVQIIIRDTTRERETLNNLEHSASELMRLNRMKDSFLGIASHEIKTPLTVIMGYTELLLSDMKPELNTVASEMIKNISSAANRLDTIVKDMLDVSMIDQKQLSLKLNDIQINTLIDDVIRELSFFFTVRNQKLVSQLSNDIPAIKGDPVRLAQMLLNVIGNAIKFTPDGGTITISTRELSVDMTSDSYGFLPALTVLKGPLRFLEIEIHDTGIGIDTDDLQKIFDKFYEAGNIEEHSSGKVAFKSRGIGLGLSIAKGVVEMHGGAIWAESPGHDSENCPGSSFFIRLPLDPVKTDGTISS